MQKILISLLLIIVSAMFSYSCKKSNYLNAKPNDALVVPKTLKDFQALMDNDNVMNGCGDKNEGVIPSFGQAASDDYYVVNDASFTVIHDAHRYLYTWNDDLYGSWTWYDWAFPYNAIFYSNLVLDNLSGLEISPNEQSTYNNIWGSALFHRAHMFYQLAQVFAPHYDVGTANTDWGIPLRLTSDVNENIRRSTVQQTYGRILGDLKESINFLPDTALYKTRPSKLAAYGLLARVYQTMQKYDSSFFYANKYLQIKNNLMDYNGITVSNTTYPFLRDNNVEVVFNSILLERAMPLLIRSRARVDSILYFSYSNNDKRRTLFFRDETATGGKSFKGSYDGATTLKFGGIATDEIYLIRAECYARSGNIQLAMKDLNDLLRTRWTKVGSTSTYTDQSAIDQEDALNKIFTERRKELLYRGLRWTDLRRLNKEGRNIIVTRYVNNQFYRLLPNSLKYTFLIPPEVIGFNPDMPQNSR
ncbi:MAG TPA: RagB/SusD family nutrient uptake outer membrane protein [Chitinophagaceae bacterium]